MKSNVVAVLCYLLGIIGGILFLVLDPYKKDAEIRFHAWQSIMLVGAYIVVSVAVQILSSIVSVFAFLSIPLSLGLFALWIVLMVKSYQGSKLKLPVLGDYAEKMAKS